MNPDFRADKWYRRSRPSSIVVIAALSGATLLGDTAGRGRTGPFEVACLQFIINHHASALRMTELAGGTDTTRDAALLPAEGTSPTEGFQSTPSRSRLDSVRSMARMANRMQREEIAKAPRMLREWYGVEARPTITAEGRQM